MNKLNQLFTSIPLPLRVLGFALIAVLSHFTVRGIRKLGESILTLRISKETPVQETFTRKYPKTATLLTILVSSITFTIYFFAIGFILKEFKVSLKTYLASASVIGLAIGFGTQGFVQDVISGLTLISAYSRLWVWAKRIPTIPAATARFQRSTVRFPNRSLHSLRAVNFGTMYSHRPIIPPERKANITVFV
jgi:hypothetical protein